MKKKTIGILLIISLVMIMSISAISAADTNDTSLKKVSDTNIAATSVAVVQKDNATSLVSEKSNDVEINVDDSRNENHKVDSVSSASKEVLSASNDDLLKHSDKNFLYGGEWYYDLEDAWSAAENNNGGTIKVWTGYYKYTEDDDDFEYTVNTAVSITLEPYGNGPVFFDGGESGWFLRVTNNNVKVTINDINFRNMKARDGGAIEVEDGAQLTLNRCIFESNYASSDGVSYGLGGAIDVDEGSLIANDCKFINNKADRYGGAICIEDKGSVTLNNCYFEGNKKGSDEANDFDDYSIDSGESADWSFNNCLFIGSGSLDIEVDAPTKSVTITPNVDDDIDKIVLYKNGVEYDDEACNNLRPVTFSHLEKGTYTVYLMKGDGKRYEYSGTTFTIIEPNFILNDDQVFETLSAAVNAISSGGSGVITVEGETYTESANFNVQINNKIVTIRPKSDDSVTFSGNSYSNFLIIGSGSKLTLEEITITGKFSDSALKFNANSEGEISDCEFKDIKNSQNQPGNPINAQNSNLVFNGTTFESNGPTLFKSTIVKIDDCTFTSNSGTKGGAINADSSTDLTVTNSEFTSNEASEEGGAIYASNLKLQDSEFTLNSAELGGAVYITNLANNLVNITECVFDDNLATNYRNIYSQSPERKFNLQYNEYDLYLKIYLKDSAYGSEYILDGVFDWGSNLNNTYTLLTGVADEQEVFGDLLTVVDNKFNINLGIIPGGTHEFVMGGMYTQGDSHDHFYGGDYYNDLNGNEFYLNDTAYAKIGIEKGNISLTLDVKDVLIPETPVLNVYANWDLNYTIFIGSNYYQVQVVNGKASIQLTGLDLGNYTVVAMRDADENFNLAMNFTTFSISKTYSNFLVLSTNVEYDTLAEAVANSNSEDMIYIKKGTYQDTGIVISNKTLDIIALEGAVFDAQGGDANFIIVKESAEVYMEGIAFTGLHNRNTNYGAIVNYGDLTLDSCNFTDNRITKTSFAENGGAAIFNNGHSLDIENCNFINNVAPLKVSTAAVTSWGFEDVSIVSSKFINNTARQGGAVYFGNISQFEPAIVSCDFEQNTAVKGSAIYVGNNSRYLSVALSNFKKNDIKNNFGENTQLEGGVIYVNAGNTEVTFDIGSSNFENNSNGNVDGGVICLDGISKAVIGSCIFNNNRGKLGSAILIKNPYNKKLFLVIDDSEFTNNNATTGAIATSSKVTTFIDECIFTNNTGENRHIYSNGFTVVHDSILDVKNAKLSALSVQYGENSIISGTADIGTNLYAEANLTVANENVTLEIKNNAFTYNAGILNRGKYYAVLNNIADSNNNTYLVDSISEIFRVTNVGFDLVVSVDNITYGETLKVVERLPANVTGALDYQLNGKYYTKDEIESLKLDAGKYTLVATYNHEDYTFTSTTVNFEVYKANPTISVADVEADYNESFIVNIETNVPSVYIIEIGEYKNAVYVNGSRSVEIKNVFEPGNYTIKVTSRERVNYISNFTEAILKVNGPSLANSLSNGQSSMDDNVTVENGNNKVNLNRKNLRNTLLLGEEEEGGKFIYQTDEDSDYEYCDSLDEAIAKVELWGEGIITVRGGTYSVSSIDIEGEIEFTIQAYEDEEVIFDCGGDDYFMLLTYDTEMEWVQTPPPPHPEFEQTDGPTVTLQNITVINGVATYGGAIDLEAGSLTLINCNFYNNHATSQGGAIYIGKWDAENDATLIAVNTTFINNYAEGEGGAIYIASDNLDGQSTSASFLLCSFLDNYQGEDDEREMNYFAGGNADEITCSYCVFSGKGEVYNFAIDKINQTVYVKGTSVDPFDSVVLLYSDQIPLYTINNNGSRDFNVTFEEVMAGNYTVGLMNDHNFNSYVFGIKFEMRVPNFILSADEVYENLTDAIDAVAENGIIYANVNYYDEDNMEIDIRKSFTLKNFKADGVTFDGGSQKWFFTIAEGYNVVFDGITFTDGAIKTFATIENYGNLVIKNCSFEGFETSTIIQNFGLLNILNSEFTLNLVDNTLVWNNRDLVIDTVEFSSNIVNKSSAVYNNGVADIVSSNFTENYNGGNGGAIYNKNSLSINSTSFNENEAVNGGAVYNEGSLEVLNSTFEDNTAKGYGGAIFNGRQANVYNSTFTGGYSEKDGGAIYNNYTMTVNNSTLIANSANGNGGAIYNNKSFEITKSIFGINFADEFANIYNAGDIQYSENTFDFYDVILIIPDGQYGIPTIITGTLNPEFNMDLQVTLPGFVDHKDATVTINEGVFEYNTGVLPKGTYDVRLEEVLYDSYGNIYYGEEIYDRLFVRKANVYINLTVDDVVLPGTPVLKINISKDGPIHLLFNNKFSVVNITNGQATLTLDTVGEGNYSVWVVREGDENYNDAANATTFTVSEYEGNFIVNSSGYQYDTLREALSNSLDDDIIYARAGVYSGADNIGLTISNKKLKIISLGDVVFDANSTDLSFITVDENADVNIYGVAIRGFNSKDKIAVINNKGNLTVDECIVINNTISEGNCPIIYNNGNLTVVGTEFNGNVLSSSIISSESNLIINGSSFENNTINFSFVISITNANSTKIVSSSFSKNSLKGSIIYAVNSEDIYINSIFFNNTQEGNAIYAYNNNNLIVNDSSFTSNIFDYVIVAYENTQNTISGSIFLDNTARNVVYSTDKNLSVLESTFSLNTLSDYGALLIASKMNASVNGSVFTNNNANKYRNIYSVCDLNITNSVFDALNVDFTVYDINYRQLETIEGTIDIGTNLNFTVNLDIDYNSYSVNVTDNKFTYTSGILNGGDYEVVLNEKDVNSNTCIFDKITKIFTVNRIDPELNVTIADITQGEKLKVNVTISKNARANVVYGLNGNLYNKDQLENLSLIHGNYLVTAMYRGDKNHLPVTLMVGFEVHKFAPNITVNDLSVNYTDKININVTVDVPDYYTVFLGNESISLYVEDSAIFTFASENFKPDIYEITVYVFETDDYAEAYAYANLTVNKAVGVFNLSNDVIEFGENATVSVKIPINASGNITYYVYDEDKKLVYNITQSCFEVLVVPNLNAGKYNVTGTYEGDSYYTNESIINYGTIFVNTQGVDLNLTVSNITYEENATVTIESNIDGDYLVQVDNRQFVVTVINGTGNVSVSNLYAGIYVVNVTIVDGNYSAYNETEFEVAPKVVSVIISVEDIVYGEDAVVLVYGEVDGEYIVMVNNQTYTVNVIDGKGNTTISGLFVNENILANVTIADGNYSANNNTTFNVIPKEIPVVISIGNITYGENTVVIVEADLDGDYIVNIRDVNYTIAVNSGIGVKFIPNLSAGQNILSSVSIVDGNYSADNTTVFNINPKAASVVVSVGNITYGEDTVVVVESDVAGDYLVTIRDVNYTVTVTGGDGVIFIPNLAVGDQIVATVKREDNYTAFNETTFNIYQRVSNVEVAVVDITWNESAIVNVVAEVDGIYTLTVNDVDYSVEVINGSASQVISGLAAGNYTVQIAIVDGNYSASNKTEFNVLPKSISLVVSVENITYGENAVVIVESDVDGDYLVYIGNDYITITVTNGTGNVSISDLTVGSYDVNVTVVDGNYSGVNYTSFAVAVKDINVSVAVEDITYGEQAVVIVESDVDGDYLVYVGNDHFTVTVVNGTGNVSVSDLTVGSYDVNVTVVDGNYSGVNYTSFAVAVKDINVSVAVEDITYGEQAVVNVVSDVDGEYLVYVDGTPYTVSINDGVGSIVVDGLTAGSHVANVTVVDGNYSGVNTTSFAVAVKDINVSVSVEDITYGEQAVVNVVSDVDGEYLVYVDDAPYIVSVVDGVGSIVVDGMTVGSYDVNVTVVDGNYSGVNTTSFAVAVKDINVSVAVEDITYGEQAVVNVVSDVDGEYLVYVDGTPYTVSINDGVGSIVVDGLTAGSHVANVTVVDGNYSGVNTTSFAVAVKDINVSVSVEDITYGEQAVVNVVSDVDGEYLVYVDDAPYIVSVVDGVGSIVVDGLTAGSHVANVTVVDGNYSGVNYTSFAVAVKQINVSVSVEDIAYGEQAVINVVSDVDGDYLVLVDGTPYTVTVVDGVGSVSVGNLTVGSHEVNVTVVDGNYSGVNTTSFEITVKDINVTVSVGNITYGEDTVVVVQSDVAGDYIVTIRGVDYTVSVNGGDGVVFIPNLAVGDQIAVTVKREDSYVAYNETAFNIYPRPVNVEVTVDDITWSESAVVNVVAEIDGMYTLTVNDANYSIEVVDGKASQVISGLAAGTYVVQIASDGGNYSAYNITAFNVVPKAVSLDVSVENITYGENAVVIVESDVDGDYLVLVDGTPYTVSVADGIGSIAVDGLTVGSHDVNVTVVDGNYSGFDSTSFEIAIKEIDVVVSVGNITYGEDTVVVVQSDVAGDYIVTIRGVDYTVSVTGVDGTIFIPNLAVGNQIAVTVKRDDGYVAYNETAFNIYLKPVNVELIVDDITWSESAVVNVVAEVDGMYTLTVNDDVYSIEVVDGKASQVISGLAAGTYVVQIATDGGNYSAYNITAFNVVPKEVSIGVSVENISYGENAVVIVSSDVDGEYLVNVGNEQYTITVVDGKGNVTVSDLTVGNYDVNVTIVDGNYSGVDSASFAVAIKEVDLSVSVEDIVYGESAVINVAADVDGEYVVYVDGKPYTVTVNNGIGSVSVDNLTVGSHDVNVTVADGNYSGVDSASFTVDVKDIIVSVSVGNITYGEDTVVVVKSDVAGDYIVTIRGVDYTVSVNGGDGTVFIPNLAVGEQIPVTVKREDKYTGYNETAFNIYPKPVNVEIIVDAITWSENAVVNVVAEVDGTYTLTVNDDEYTIEVVDGKASQVVSGLAAGTYVVQIATEGNYSAYNITAFNVEPKSLSLDITVEDIAYGDSAVVIVVSDVDGEYLVYVDDIPYTVDVVDGIGSVSVDDLAVGSYIAEVSVIDGNYSGSDFTSFAVAVKQIDVFVSVEDIVYGESAVVNVVADVDGEYVVYVDGTPYTVDVVDGIGSISVDDLAIGSHDVKVSVVDGNYSGFDSDSFTVDVKDIIVSVSVGNITYGEDTVVVVKSDVAGDYIVTIRGVDYTVSVNGGDGTVFIPNLAVGEQIPVTVKREDKYTAYNETAFNIYPKPVNVEITVDDITWSENAVVNVVAEVDGTYTLTVNDAEYTIEVVDGKASQVISGLAAGTYVVQIATEGNYSAYNITAFNVEPKSVSISVSVVDAEYGDSIAVIVESDVDGEYLVYVDDVPYTVVVDGIGSVSVDDLAVGSHFVEVTVVDGNYSGSDSTIFDVDVKEVDLSVSVEDIIDGEKAVVIVAADVDGEYLVYVDDTPYTVKVADGIGSISVGGLDVGSHNVNVTVTDDSYLGNDSTSFTVAIKEITVIVDGKEYIVPLINGTAKVDIDNITVVVNGEEYNVPLENGTAKVDMDNITVVINGKEYNVPFVNGTPTINMDNLTVVVDGKEYVVPVVNGTGRLSSSKFEGLTVSDGLITGALVDDLGNPISNAVITYKVNGVKSTIATDDKGLFALNVSDIANIEITYPGNSTALPATISFTFEQKIRQSTVIVGNNFTQYTVDYDAGERGQNFTTQLLDGNGNPLANKTVYIGYNGKTLERVTNATGHASVQINLRDKNRLTFAVAFLGDDDYNATMSVYLITLNKKPMTITASAKTYKASATKKYTVTLKTIKGDSADGKTYLKAGKKVTLKVNGKTYTAKTNSKGQATFTLKLTKKGTYSASIKYAGDNTYNSASKTAKITIK